MEFLVFSNVLCHIARSRDPVFAILASLVVAYSHFPAEIRGGARSDALLQVSLIARLPQYSSTLYTEQEDLMFCRVLTLYTSDMGLEAHHQISFRFCKIVCMSAILQNLHLKADPKGSKRDIDRNLTPIHKKLEDLGSNGGPCFPFSSNPWGFYSALLFSAESCHHHSYFPFSLCQFPLLFDVICHANHVVAK